MTPDNELLRRYAETNSEEAFAELVQRHLVLVYSAALRQVNGDTHLAQDIAQTVFTDLARKAASLSRHEMLPAGFTPAPISPPPGPCAASDDARPMNRRLKLCAH